MYSSPVQLILKVITTIACYNAGSSLLAPIQPASYSVRIPML